MTGDSILGNEDECLYERDQFTNPGRISTFRRSPGGDRWTCGAIIPSYYAGYGAQIAVINVSARGLFSLKSLSVDSRERSVRNRRGPI